MIRLNQIIIVVLMFNAVSVAVGVAVAGLTQDPLHQPFPCPEASLYQGFVFAMQ